MGWHIIYILMGWYIYKKKTKTWPYEGLGHAQAQQSQWSVGSKNFYMYVVEFVAKYIKYP
jgi:hypothetical protein